MRLFTLRGLMVLLGWGLVAGWRILRWTAAHWAWTLPAAGFILGSWYVAGRSMWLWGAACTGAILLCAGGWAELRGVHTWAQLTRELSSLRRLWWYRRKAGGGWDDVMDGCGLVRAQVVPLLEAHSYGGQVRERDLDVLTVVMAPGSLPGDYRAVSSRLASAFGATGCRAHPVYGRPGVVQLFVRHRRLPDALTVDQRAAAGDPHTEEEGTDTAALPAQAGAFPRTPRRTA